VNGVNPGKAKGSRACAQGRYPRLGAGRTFRARSLGTGIALLLGTISLACSALPDLDRPPTGGGPPAENECAVEIVNQSGVPMGVTIHTRSTYDLGIVQPGRSVRYKEECTPRTWTVTGLPRLEPVRDPEDGAAEPPTRPPPSGMVTRQVEVRPGEVTRVVL
jgi:hypothetical protein